jgi:hypothetical protein
MAEFRATARQAREENFKARRQAMNSLKNVFQMSKKNIKRMLKPINMDSIFAKARAQAEVQERAARKNTRRFKTHKLNPNAEPFFPSNYTFIDAPEEDAETRAKQLNELQTMGSRLPIWLKTRRRSRF